MDHWRITNKYHELLIHHCRVKSNKVHINILKAILSATACFLYHSHQNFEHFHRIFQFRDDKKYKSFIATCLSLSLSAFPLQLSLHFKFFSWLRIISYFRVPFLICLNEYPVPFTPFNPGLLSPSVLAKFSAISRISILPFNTFHV